MMLSKQGTTMISRPMMTQRRRKIRISSLKNDAKEKNDAKDKNDAKE